MAPGGRWNRFKTYSTIQRTLEIWGFVFTFLFRAWVNNQKFSYRGLFMIFQPLSPTISLIFLATCDRVNMVILYITHFAY